jgi:hypothetical protein
MRKPSLLLKYLLVVCLGGAMPSNPRMKTSRYRRALLPVPAGDAQR